jgi:hypothetical protein
MYTLLTPRKGDLTAEKRFLNCQTRSGEFRLIIFISVVKAKSSEAGEYIADCKFLQAKQPFDRYFNNCLCFEY